MHTPSRHHRSQHRYAPLIAILLSLLSLLLAGGCQRTSGGHETEEKTATVDGQATQSEGDASIDAHAPLRLISTNGALTDIVYELGLGDTLVGVDTSSTYPNETGALPKVGYYRQLSAEGLVSLDPTHILVGPDAGPSEVLRQVESANVGVIEVRKVTEVSDIGARIAEVGEALGVRERAHELQSRIDEELDDLKQQAPIDGNPRGAFVYARGPETLLIAGDHSVAQLMFDLAGATNAVTGFDEFRPLTAEALVAAQPDFIAVPEDGMASIGGVDGMLRLPGVAQTPAGQHRVFIAVDDLRFLGGGPRAAEAAREFRQTVTSSLPAADEE